MKATSTPPLILREQRGEVVLLTLNRPEKLNALNTETWILLHELVKQADKDESVRCVVITGGSKVFAAGADISEMTSMTGTELFKRDLQGDWVSFACRKPVIAAVAGYALGGGLEVVLMADIVICDYTARFGLPEIKLGILPGGGGTQRLPRLVGRAVALDMILSARQIGAKEAYERALVSRVVKEGESVVEEAVKIAERISRLGGVAVTAAKEATLASENLPLLEGMRLERRLNQQLFNTRDKDEGVAAFIEKRRARFSHL